MGNFNNDIPVATEVGKQVTKYIPTLDSAQCFCSTGGETETSSIILERMFKRLRYYINFSLEHKGETLQAKKISEI